MKRKIMLIFIGLMAAMLFAIWAINNWWLGEYYVNQKLKVMEQAYADINEAAMEIVEGGDSIGDVLAEELDREWEMWRDTAKPEKNASEQERGKERRPAENDGTLLGTIRAYSEQNNIKTVLIDSNTGKAILNTGRDSDFLVQKAQRYVLGQGDERAKTLKEHEDYVVEMNHDFRSSSAYMESWGFLSDNSTMFIMSMPLASVQESAALSNRFTTWVVLITLLFGSILMYFVTNRVTKPLLKLAALSEEMSNLNFDVSYEDDARDEVGVLGRSMNTLSDKLKETIGELKEANVKLQHDIEEKIRIDEMRKEFIANVSHELKTPIALIQGYAEGLSEGMCEDAESRNYYCEVITDEAGKMNKMVKQLLTLTALEFGNDTPSMEPFDLSELIREFANSSGSLIQQNAARLELEIPEKLVALGDEFKIEEVLTNYLTNAMNHLDGERTIRIRAEKEKDRAKVSVYNAGQPIPEEDIPNLWTKFYKVDKARTRAYGGSGIGLSIVKAIMDAHHQECGVRNTENGVEFWFTLALAADQSL